MLDFDWFRAELYKELPLPNDVMSKCVSSDKNVASLRTNKYTNSDGPFAKEGVGRESLIIIIIIILTDIARKSFNSVWVWVRHK